MAVITTEASFQVKGSANRQSMEFTLRERLRASLDVVLDIFTIEVHVFGEVLAGGIIASFKGQLPVILPMAIILTRLAIGTFESNLVNSRFSMHLVERSTSFLPAFGLFSRVLGTARVGRFTARDSMSIINGICHRLLG